MTNSSILSIATLVALLPTLAIAAPASVQELEVRLQETQKLLVQLQEQVAAQARELERLRGATAVSSELSVQPTSPSKVLRSATVGGAIEIGAVVDAVAAFRSESKEKVDGDRPGGADVQLRGAELTLSGSIDPFGKGYIVTSASADSDGEASLEVEEAAVVTSALPNNLSARFGRFFGEFGRLAYRHDHDLPFVERPLVLEEYIGGEPKVDGVELNWLLPLDHFVSLTMGVGNQFGEEQSQSGGFRALSELSYFGRIGTYADLSDESSIELGSSAVFVPSSKGRGELPETERFLAGIDLTYRYQPLDATNYSGIEWGTELLFNRGEYASASGKGGGSDGEEIEFDLSGERDHESAFGAYSYVAGKLNRSWTVGFLVDYVQELTEREIETLRYSPYVTWKLSEFQHLRFQYSYTDQDSRSELENEHAGLLQWTHYLGAHAHGFRQR